MKPGWTCWLVLGKCSRRMKTNSLTRLRLISEYDPEAERVTASADESLAAGAHQLVLTLRDAAGNERVATTDFVSR